MAHTYTVLTPDDRIVGEADDLQAAVTIMGSYYLRLLEEYLVVVSGDETLAVIGAAPIDIPPAQIPLQIAVGHVGALSYAFTLQGIDKKATIDFGDEQTKDVTKNGLATNHTYAGPGSFHVVATEGDRSGEAWVTISEPEA